MHMEGGDVTDITALVDESGGVPLRCEPDDRGWVPHGRCVASKDSGLVHLEITYDRGVAHGPYRDYWPNGLVSLEGQYVRGVQEGEWRFYDDETGELREVLRFEGGREVIDWDEFFRSSKG
jgi:hypothetical protein